MSKKLTMPKNVQSFINKYGGIGSKEQDSAFWKEFRKAANAYANVQAKRICDLEHALAEARGQRDRLVDALRGISETNLGGADDLTVRYIFKALKHNATEALQSLTN
tara:strand:- start:2004 stop:2324 length:321 start_codon:yes stop_codon:yes gene_type:complete